MKRRARLLRYLRPHRRELAVVLATMLLSSGIGLLAPWPTKLLIDNVLGDSPLPAWLADVLAFLPGPDDAQGLLVWVAIATLLIFFASTTLEMVSSVASVRLGQRVTYDLGAAVFLHLQRLSLVFHGRRPVGDTIARVTSDTFGVQTLISAVILPTIQSGGTLVAMFIIMWALSPSLTLLALAVVPLQLVAIKVFGRPMKERSRRRLDEEGRLLSVVQQTLTAIPAVQAFTREEVEHGRFRAYADRTVAAYIRETMAGAWFKLFAGTITACGTAGILYLGARQALDGDVTAGTIIVFLAYLSGLYGPLDQIAYTASTYQLAGAQSDRVLEVLEIEPDVRDAPRARPVGECRGAVRYEGVTFGYEPGRPVLHDVSFEVQPGEVIAIVGPTGAGKTTLVNLLMRSFDPDAGRVLLDGVDLRDVRVRSLRENISVVLQEPFIFPLSVAENIAYGRPDATQEQIEAAATAANADRFIRRLPEGYESVIGERGATLSGGEKQRLSIARAFVKDAPLLILDEPTSALDARTEAALLDALRRLSSGRTAFIIAHRLSTIRGADRILVLDEGRIVEQGGHEDLLAAGGMYASLYNQQMNVTRHEKAPHDAEAALAAVSGNGAAPAEQPRRRVRRFLRRSGPR